ncbi:bifunctional homocysteine S-methyltransferase/methylenetetrahydrofolate reductase [Alicyclobacillus mali (ex Roth et al. 2021)]|uniref:bifunctional homocysteine S-methyltransferase/methylenetetrahydrofolate reductase n=1 Tax=Alicyclobacillus mali (ex Roth et al. 2021) TaxID=1123961 RepID=UPI001A8F7D53|nr:bifunctional homocysteine S-methyltransferase/methylenetetrahydrofolate reductase [Alicyclobacillus mali (ex Roth et al. 2021)]MCL6487654.1 bifunctional homocysteine S-methyltransferase/methylenetetrahydrofolate reductase [Alicyclobacillus mali (ex Roth et al. 2021)]
MSDAVWRQWRRPPRDVEGPLGAYVLFDGAMSTYMHQLGVPIGTPVEQLNLTSPDLVARVHRRYVEAGCTVVQTNTFMGNRLALERHGLHVDVLGLNRRGVEIARSAARDQASVYGTMGPAMGGYRYGALLQDEERDVLARVYAEQAEALVGAGIDGLVLETFPDLEEALVAIAAVRPILGDLPLVVNLSPEEIGVTRDGVPLAHAFRRIREAGADVVGVNCRLGPYGILRSYEQAGVTAGGPYAAVPNAGILQRSEGDEIAYTGDTEDFSRLMLRIAQLGVQWLGGCCGTTPEYIRALRDALMRAERTSGDADVPAHVHAASRRTTVAVESGAGVYHDGMSVVDIAKERKAIVVELDPPKHLSIGRFLEGAEALARAGADLITMADNSLGSVRVSNMALASLLKQRDIEPLVHVTCRDRNLIGQQSHLMGLAVLGIRNVLLVTGDPSRYGELPGATSVYDVSSMDLTKMVRRLNEGIGFSGQPLKQPSRFVIGTAFNPHVHNFQKAAERLKRKVEAGADFVMTQPVFDADLMEAIAEATRDLGVPVFVGIMPLTSLRNAEFLHHQVPGIRLSDEALRRMRETSPEEAPAVGEAIARELVEMALQRFPGIYLVTPFLRYDMTARLTLHARTLEARLVAEAHGRNGGAF